MIRSLNPGLGRLVGPRLDRLTAAAVIRECGRLLSKSGDNIVSEVLRGQGPFYEWDHYPTGDVYDPETHCRYYYHAHGPAARIEEHGHFHTFLHASGMPPGMLPLDLPDAPARDKSSPAGGGTPTTPPPDSKECVSHLVAIAMDRFGNPIRLFTTNRWVTGEVWYRAEDVVRMVDRFEIDLARPSWPVNLWITAMMRLFREEIAALLMARDREVAALQARHPDRNAFEDRSLEVTSCLDISVAAQLIRVAAREDGLRSLAPRQP